MVFPREGGVLGRHARPAGGSSHSRRGLREELRLAPDRLPCRVPAFHVTRIEPRIAQDARHAATDVESIYAENYDGVGLREVLDPFLHAVGIAPCGTVHDLALTRRGERGARIDDLDVLPGVDHRLHF